MRHTAGGCICSAGVCSEGGVSPTIGPEYSIPANTL
jgi:hypothetical protein